MHASLEVNIVEMHGLAGPAHRGRYNFGEIFDRVWLIGANIKHLIAGTRLIDRNRDVGSYVTDMREGTHLIAISEDRHRLVAKQLIHENSYDIAITIANILPFAVHIVRPEDNVVQAEHLVADFQFLLDGEFRDTVGVLGHRGHIFGQWGLACTINCD